MSQQADLILSLTCTACDFAELTTDPQRIDAALTEHEALDGHRLALSAPPEAENAELRNVVLNGMLDLLRVLNRESCWVSNCTCGWIGGEWTTEDEANEEAFWHGTVCRST